MRIAITFCVFAGCADVPQPFELDHARVMAVRIEPPALAAGEVARVDVLVTDGDAGPRIAPPDEVTIAPLPGVDIGRDTDGWYVVAPAVAANTVAALAISVRSIDGEQAVQKTLAFGARAENPRAPSILLDGLLMGASVEIGGSTERVLSTDLPAADEAAAELSYRWFSSIGELVGYTRASATLEPASGDGHIAVVVRDQAGGTAWTLVTATVTP
ncbi:MAG: hypothetical protein ACKV2T_37660 [Kofleriaceae bacterium]